MRAPSSLKGRRGFGEGLDARTRAMYRIVAWGSFFVIVGIIVYGLSQSLYGSKEPVGQVLVDVYWPFPPYLAQPVTFFSIASVAMFYSGLRIWEERVSKWPPWLLSFLQLFGFIVAFSSAYEVLYNFMLWGATYSIACASLYSSSMTCNPDVLFSTYPVPWNLVFATRAFSALFVISGYSVYFVRRLTASSII
jgi:hypothetical protein